MTILATFFDVDCREAIEGKSDSEALDILRAKIADAEHAKTMGSGPPRDDIDKVRRLWMSIYERLYGKAA